MTNLVNNYYQNTTLAEAKLLKRGQLCWAPGQYLPTSISTLELTHYEPTDERLNRYVVLPNPPRNLPFNHTPVHELQLEHDEELIIVKAKKRLFLVISQAPISGVPGANRLRGDGFVCLPFYTFHTTDSPDFQARIRVLEYPWWLYMPGDNTFHIKEGFARLDRLQVIEKNLLEPIQVALTSDALFFTSEWVRYYLTGEIESVFLEDRLQMIQSLSTT